MANILEQKERAFNFFTEFTPRLYANFRRVNNPTFSITTDKGKADVILHFSQFIPEHQDAAAAICSALEQIMNEEEDDSRALQKVLNRVNELKQTENPDLLNYAFMVFITHHPRAKTLPIPPLELREPVKVAPSASIGAETASAAMDNADPYENVLRWYREDPLSNEHHEHWHIVYPVFGLNPGSTLLPVQDRRGELFLYMHRQMLARYDCERISVGLPRVVPFANFSEDIDVAVAPNKFLRGEFESFHLPYAAREPNSSIRDITWPGDPSFGIKEMEERKKRLYEIIENEKILLHTIKQSAFSKIKGISAEDSFEIFKELHAKEFIMGTRNRTENTWAEIGYITPKFTSLTSWEDLELPEKFAKHKKRIYEIVKAGVRYEDFPLTLENLNSFANLFEVNVFTREGPNRSWKNYYGNHHGSGHNLSAQINSDENLNNGGIMSDTTVAIRDPFFYRWHKHVDEFYFKWQEKLESYDFGKEMLNVVIRSGGSDYSPDIILCLKKDFPGSELKGFDGFHEGRYAFGYNAKEELNAWEKDFTNTEFTFQLGMTGINKTARTTDTLITRMDKRMLTYRFKDTAEDPIVKEIKEEIEYLNHEPFAYFIRLENNELWSKKVTVRIFIVPLEYEEDRLMWIEMDKFVQELRPKEKQVIYRADEDSSIIRKPAIKDPSTIDLTWKGYNKASPDFEDDSEVQQKYYCDCGWPYSLLLPRGKSDGQLFKLMVMITDWEQDRVGDEDCCGSMSYCGARNRYPDKRPMGYPFDRPFSKEISMSDTIASCKNMASRTIKIKFT